MNSNFAARLSSLRKEKGISQKEAAKMLGVSQSLLSHYEKGIRECGLDFLCVAAEYYSVSCDYLLGRSVFRNAEDIIPENADGSVSAMSAVYGCASDISKEINKHTGDNDELCALIYSSMLYRILISGAQSGILPESWVNPRVLENSELVKGATDGLITSLVSRRCEEITHSADKAPENIQKTEDRVLNRLNKEMSFLVRK